MSGPTGSWSILDIDRMSWPESRICQDSNSDLRWTESPPTISRIMWWRLMMAVIFAIIWLRIARLAVVVMSPRPCYCCVRFYCCTTEWVELLQLQTCLAKWVLPWPWHVVCFVVVCCCLFVVVIDLLLLLICCCCCCRRRRQHGCCCWACVRLDFWL